MPDKDACRKLVQRARNEIENPPPNPLNLADLIIPDAYRYYEPNNGQRELFLLADNGGGGGNNNNRILLFGRSTYINWSATMKNIYMDGTFAISPPLFSQVLISLVLA